MSLLTYHRTLDLHEYSLENAEIEEYEREGDFKNNARFTESFTLVEE